MKKRVLFSACALAACFAACTNDDFQTVKENAVVNEAGEVIGADLVSAGMTISSFGDKAPATRASVGENGVQWDANDETGLAWFQYDPAITAAQDKDSWYNTASGSMSNECSIFANHRFAYQGATGWQTVTDVYAGSYFAYWPYAKLGGAVPKEVSANQEIPQTADFRDEYLNKALRMSGQDFIEKNDVDEESVLQKQFYLFPMVNVIGVVATPDANINNDYLKGMEITKMTINAGGDEKAVFVDGGTIVPRVLPKAVKVVPGMGYVQKSEGEMRTEMEEVAANATATAGTNLLYQPTAASSQLYTDIDADFNLAAAHTLRAFAFPIQEGVSYLTNQYPSIDVTVSSTTPGADWILGTFHVTNNTQNSPVIANLKDMLDADKEGETNSWIKNIMGDDSWRIASSEKNMTAMLNVDDFTPATTLATGNTIDSEAEWNDMVALVNALKEAGKANFTEVEFELGDNVTLNNEIQAPDDVKIVLNTTDAYTLTVNGPAVEWPANLVTDKSDKVVVADGATLNVGVVEPGTEAPEIILNATIENNGTIYAGAKASISTQDSKALDNTNGTVFVEYGAYVYPSTEATVGEIAFEVKDNALETMAEINTLIQKDNSVFNEQNEYAYVNTLYVGTEDAQVTLDLNAQSKKEIEGDRYETEDTPAEYLLSLKNIDIVLVNGAVVYIPNSIQNYMEVKNVISRKGVNVMQDVIPQGNIDIENGSELTIKSEIYDAFGNDKDLELPAADATIDNKGKLVVTTTINTVNIINDVYKQSNTDVEPDETIWYTGTYTQGGTATGNILRKVEDPVSYENLSTEAKAVVDAFKEFADDVKEQEGSCDNFQALVDWWKNNKSNNPNDQWTAVIFYKALSTWFGSVGLPTLDTLNYEDISVTMFETFENMTGYQFTF